MVAPPRLRRPSITRQRTSLVAPQAAAAPLLVAPASERSRANREAMLQALVARGSSTAPVQSVTEGVARMLTAGVGGLAQSADAAFEQKQRRERAQRLAAALEGGVGGSGAVGGANAVGGPEQMRAANPALAQALLDNPALEGVATEALARQQFPELFAEKLSPRDRAFANLTPEQQARALGATPPDLSPREQAFAGLSPEQQARALGAEQTLTPQQRAFANLTPEQQAIALGASRPPEVRRAQTEPGRIIEDRQSIIDTYGEDSPQLRAFNEAVEAEQEGEGPRLTDVAGLRKEFTSQSRDFIAVRDSFAKIRSAAENPSAAGDLSLIFNFMKMLDPGSVVREGEFATAQNAAGVDDQVRNLYNRAITGERLNPEQRADFVGQANRIFVSQANLQEDLEGTFRGIAERQGFDPENVVIDFRTATQSEGGPQAGGRNQLGPLGTQQVGATPEGRPIIQNPDGSFSTERSITVTDQRINGGRPTNIPSIFGGREVTQEQAISIIVNNNGSDPETGRRLPGFDTIEQAESAARQRSTNIANPAQQTPQAAAPAQTAAPPPAPAAPPQAPRARRGPAPLGEAAIPTASLEALQRFIAEQGGEENLTDQQRRAIEARLQALGL